MLVKVPIVGEDACLVRKMAAEAGVKAEEIVSGIVTLYFKGEIQKDKKTKALAEIGSAFLALAKRHEDPVAGKPKWIEDEAGNRYRTAAEAARKLKLNIRMVHYVLKGHRKSTGGHSLRWIY